MTLLEGWSLHQSVKLNFIRRHARMHARTETWWQENEWMQQDSCSYLFLTRLSSHRMFPLLFVLHRNAKSRPVSLLCVLHQTLHLQNVFLPSSPSSGSVLIRRFSTCVLIIRLQSHVACTALHSHNASRKAVLHEWESYESDKKVDRDMVSH